MQGLRIKAFFLPTYIHFEYLERSHGILYMLEGFITITVSMPDERLLHAFLSILY